MLEIKKKLYFWLQEFVTCMLVCVCVEEVQHIVSSFCHSVFIIAAGHPILLKRVFWVFLVSSYWFYLIKFGKQTV